MPSLRCTVSIATTFIVLVVCVGVFATTYAVLVTSVEKTRASVADMVIRSQLKYLNSMTDAIEELAIGLQAVFLTANASFPREYPNFEAADGSARTGANPLPWEQGILSLLRSNLHRGIYSNHFLRFEFADDTLLYVTRTATDGYDTEEGFVYNWPAAQSRVHEYMHLNRSENFNRTLRKSTLWAANGSSKAVPSGQYSQQWLAATYFWHADRAIVRGNESCRWLRVVEVGSGPELLASIVCPIWNASGTFLGTLYIGQDTRLGEEYMRANKATPNMETATIGRDISVIFSASQEGDGPVVVHDHLELEAQTRIPDLNCVVWGVNRERDNSAGTVCFRRLANSKSPALRACAEHHHPSLELQGPLIPDIRAIEMDGVRYFSAFGSVDAKLNGTEAFLLAVVLPMSDLAGTSVFEARDLSIGVTIAVFVGAALVTIAVVMLSLRDLERRVGAAELTAQRSATTTDLVPPTAPNGKKYVATPSHGERGRAPQNDGSVSSHMPLPQTSSTASTLRQFTSLAPAVGAESADFGAQGPVLYPPRATTGTIVVADLSGLTLAGDRGISVPYLAGTALSFLRAARDAIEQTSGVWDTGLIGDFVTAVWWRHGHVEAAAHSASLLAQWRLPDDLSKLSHDATAMPDGAAAGGDDQHHEDDRYTDDGGELDGQKEDLREALRLHVSLASGAFVAIGESSDLTGCRSGGRFAVTGPAVRAAMVLLWVARETRFSEPKVVMNQEAAVRLGEQTEVEIQDLSGTRIHSVYPVAEPLWSAAQGKTEAYVLQRFTQKHTRTSAVQRPPGGSPPPSSAR